MAMPNRNVEGNYRYTYQGQEKDQETGMEAFELRLWDSRIGRWLTTDPYGQFYSSYLGMGNNPINGIDPDGGIFNPLGAKASALWEKYKAIISKTDRGKRYIDVIENDESFVVTIKSGQAPDGSSFAYQPSSQTLYLNEGLTDEELEKYVDDFNTNEVHPSWINAGHELFHIVQHYGYDYNNGAGSYLKTSRTPKMEADATRFQNYLYSVTSNGDNFRRRYAGIRIRGSKTHEDSNPQLEKLRNIQGIPVNDLNNLHQTIQGSLLFQTFKNPQNNRILNPRYF